MFTTKHENLFSEQIQTAAAWGDAAVFVPWVLYQRYGDVDILAQQFDSMRAWVDLLTQITGPELLRDSGMQFGDWLDPAAPSDRPGDARTPAFIVATANFARSAELVGQNEQIKRDIEARQEKTDSDG